MDIVLSNRGNVYEQIVEHFKKYITLGVYQNDDKLPSCRQLATELGVNPNTVEKAYSKLEEDGFVVALPKKGYFVSHNKEISNSDIKEHIQVIKDRGIPLDELISIVREVYEND